MRVELDDGRVKLHGDDCRDVLRDMEDNSVDSVVCDPPYALVSIQKRFGKEGSAPTKDGDVYSRSSAGFMGKNWDTGETAFAVEFWEQVFRVLKPGGHVVAFSGTRTYHRMTCAIEDAGFEIRDQLGWLYGSGFPKSHDVSKGIDKKAGHWRGRAGDAIDRTVGQVAKGTEYVRADKSDPITEDAKKWEGWGTALKPCWEPICLARKPLEGTVVENVLKWGTGSLNIDGCRVGDEGGTRKSPSDNKSSTTSVGGYLNSKAGEPIDAGRWPTNIMHDGSQHVVSGFPDETYRFFYCAKASKADREEGLVSDEERANTHPTVKPTELMRWLCRLVTPKGGVILDPFMGSGSTGKAAVIEDYQFIGCEREEEYIPISRARIEWVIENKDLLQRGITPVAKPSNDNQPELFAA